ncbi:MAG: AAA family ATPase [Devosia sp.]|uniref:AAA family ATPase n=1 Tax=Devosia sp. TaxID=1871048 RepID=UPI003394F47B
MASQRLDDLTEQFRQFIMAACQTDPGTIVADGRWHRFRISDTRHKGSKPGRYLMHADGKANGIFMDWRDGTRHKWFAGGKYESVDRLEIERRRQARRFDQLRGFQIAAEEAADFWSSCSALTDGLHPYLAKKDIVGLGTRQGSGKRFGLGDVPCVIVPLSDAENRPMSLQAIREDGERRFWPGSTHEGAHFLVGKDDGKSPVVFCEGFSTAATIRAATGYLVVMCVNTGNMAAVARWATHRWYGREMIVAGDDDWHLLDHPKLKRNVGKEAAINMARTLGGRAVFPDMAGLVTDGGDDFNDMAREYGLEEVAAVFQQPAEPSTIDDDSAPPDALGFCITDWSTDRFYGDAPPIQWLCEGTIPQGVPALFAAMGGVGKSFIALDLALEIAAAVAFGQERRVLGGKVLASGSVLVLNAEDSKDSVHRRLAAIDTGGRREGANGKVFIVPLPEVGGPMPLVAGGPGAFLKTDKFEALLGQLERIPDLRLIIIDPLQAFVTADITKDPAAGQFMWSAFAEICARTGATVLACHHMRKDGAAKIVTADDARETIRGSTALVDGARATYALWAACDEDTQRICAEAGVEPQRKRVVHGAVVKANDQHDLEIHTYVRADNGLLMDATDAGRKAASQPGALTNAQALDALREIDRRWIAKEPFSSAPNSGGGRFLGGWLQRQFHIPKTVANSQMDKWFDAQILGIEEFDKRNSLRGIRVQNWPD